MVLMFLCCLLSSDGIEAYSFDGKPLKRRSLAPKTLTLFEKNLAQAKADLKAEPDDVMHHIWVGRRQAYLGYYGRAIETFSKAVEQFPKEARLYRHRGHRYITIRKLDAAIADFQKAAALTEGSRDIIEPDGLPNAAGIPTSSLQTNIWYHLGLAFYLKGRFAEAQNAYERCLALCRNDDMLVATLDWLYMTLRRQGKNEAAEKLLERVGEDMNLLESFDYHKRLLLYKGLRTPESLLQTDGAADPALSVATQGYGLANWHYYHGRRAEAKELLKRVVAGEYWAAFGYLAAEAELARWEKP